MDAELEARITSAKSAFAALTRPLLSNRHLPLRLRLQLFRSLVQTRLLFGAGAWPVLTSRQLEKLQKVHLGMLKRVLRLRSDAAHHVSNFDIMVQAGTSTMRAVLARERLLFAQQMFSHSAEFVQTLAHLEFAATQTSWLAGLREDLRWAAEVDPQNMPGHWADDLTEAIDAWQSPLRPNWKSRVNRLWKRHLQQEELMIHAHGLHKLIFNTLTQGGCEFEPKLDTLLQVGHVSSGQHSCFCGKGFSTAQGLACHQRLVHQYRAPEAPFLQDATCPSCLRFLWTTNRLRSHLSYIPRDGRPNQCFARLQLMGYNVEYAVTDFPALQRGQHRCDALQAQGPLCDPTPLADRQRVWLQADADAIRTELEAALAGRDPEAGLHLGEALTTLTQTWFRAFLRHDRHLPECRDLGDSWLELLAVYDSTQDADWAAAVFMCWGRQWLPDLVDAFADGAVETYVTDEFYQLCSGLPRFHLEAELDRKECVIRALAERPAPRPHRPIYYGPANSGERLRASTEVPRLLREQELWQQQIRSVRWIGMPDAARADTIPCVRVDDGPPIYIFVHLFAGRRRWGDLHWHLQQMAREAGLRLLVLSFDTAIAPTLGDLSTTSSTWRSLQELYDRGLCAATMLGTPCETFSAARHQLPADAADSSKWPRPLRSAAKVYGLDGLRPREYRQLRAGTSFWLQGLYTAAAAVTQGGLWVSEHPAPPRNPDHVSTWRAAVTELVRCHPSIKLHIAMQYLWGATVPKPTGLLALRLPYLMRHMYQKATVGAAYPEAVAIGRDPNSGQFRTSEHKEYPSQFCQALSHAFIAQLKSVVQNGQTRTGELAAGDPLYSWMQEVAKASQQIRADASWLPDFQDIRRG
eukprot:Skav232216  [mRNA]  locus=scaffold2626:459775:462363:- [translate_table: standard]